LGIAHAHRVRDERARTYALAIVSLPTLLVASLWTMGTRFGAEIERYSVQAPALLPTLEHGPDGGWRALPSARTDFSGAVEEPMALHWAATRAQLSHVMRAAGWRTPPPWSLDTGLRWLLPGPSIEQLPVLPKFHRDIVQTIVVERLLDSQRRLVLRLWPSG
jgi:hypothetical protein